MFTDLQLILFIQKANLDPVIHFKLIWIKALCSGTFKSMVHVQCVCASIRHSDEICSHLALYERTRLGSSVIQCVNLVLTE